MASSSRSPNSSAEPSAASPAVSPGRSARATALPQKLGEIVIDGGAVPSPQSTPDALVDQDELAALVEEPDRLHEAATGRGPVSGAHVDVHGPETAGAMIRVAVAGDLTAAVRATEVFVRARKAPRQEAPRFVDPDGARRG
jgi:hypothetical protein